MGSAFYRGADCCILVYDITNSASFVNLDKWKQIFLAKAEPPDPCTLPFLVIGNKCDLEEKRRVKATTAKDYVDKQEGEALFYEVSAKNNINIEPAIRKLVEKVIIRQDEFSNIIENGSDRTINKISANNMSRRMHRSTRAKINFNPA